MVTAKPTIRLAGSAAVGALETAPRPTILQFAEPDCVLTLLDILRHPEWKTALSNKVAAERTSEKRLRLYQPVHRLFHLVLVDAACTRPGEPRLDPKRVEKAGFVIRRVRKSALQGWMRQGETVLGWKDLPEDVTAAHRDDDPDPEIRRQRSLGKNRGLLARTSHPDPLQGLSESVHPLFAAPPDVCSARGKTFYYGMLPLTSDDMAPQASSPPFDDAFLQNRIPKGFVAAAAQSGPTALSRQDFLDMLRFLERDVGAFTDSKEGQELLKILETIPSAPGSAGTTLRAVLEKAYDEMDGVGEKGLRSLPSHWPALSAAQARAVRLAIKEALTARWRATAPRRRRFDGIGDTYVVCVFVRLKGENGCPCRTVWSAPSEVFEIVPWYESSGHPPVSVTLPALDKKALSRLKPNVAFTVPPSLRKTLEKLDMNKLLDGSHEEGTGSFGMICGFNIPIITLCAFIVLQIFLGLLHIVFFWLPFVRLCIPFPGSGSSGSDSEG
uniref:Uncharacterized protein n=1 Tax=Desulfacinum infernum TaxID=35837 RepID=A0A832A8H8_9BACT